MQTQIAKTTETMRAELLLYWRASREVRGLPCDEIEPDTSIEAARDDLAAIAEFTGWQRLRARCYGNLAHFGQASA